ncbi:MAG: 3-phosphoshikimate 1-carboxyvinyltransferase [Clostridia bacterium]|nr:3-phosphoshikimate 1-carboxyvinyltransferase [Clostridia bacterium]
MNVRISGADIKGTLKAIPSKSYAHRISICNFLSGGEPTAECDGFSSKDITVTEECLKALKRGEKVLDCGESGSTLRFLLPLTAVLGGEYVFLGHGRLLSRPNEELFSVFSKHGVMARNHGDKITLSGKLTAGEYRIRGDISSQYISGLLMALPVLDGDSQIVLTTPLVSAPYVLITLEVLKSFGVNIIPTDNGYKIRGNQKYSGDILPEGDWSNMAAFLTLGAVAGSVKVTGLNVNSVQGDRAILEILKKAGARLSIDGDSVTVEKAKLRAFTFDAENCPDLVPVTAALAAFADGDTIINNIERLKIKESDRVESTIATLKAFGISAESDGHSLIVHGNSPTAGKADSFNDHRVVMAAAVLGAGVLGDSIITDVRAVDKSYPTFFEDYIKVGGVKSDV